jgi:hypothetical protein
VGAGGPHGVRPRASFFSTHVALTPKAYRDITRRWCLSARHRQVSRYDCRRIPTFVARISQTVRETWVTVFCMKEMFGHGTNLGARAQLMWGRDPALFAWWTRRTEPQGQDGRNSDYNQVPHPMEFAKLCGAESRAGDGSIPR